MPKMSPIRRIPVVALGEPVLSASRASSFERRYESVKVGMLTCFHLLNGDIVSFGLIIHLDGGHVAACLDMLITCSPLSIQSQALALLGRDMIVTRWTTYFVYIYIYVCLYEQVYFFPCSVSSRRC